MCTIFTSEVLFVSLRRDRTLKFGLDAGVIVASGLIGASPVVAVFLDGVKVLRVDVLVWVFEQGALQGLLCVPGLRPGLQVFLDGFGDPFVMRGHNLGAVLPVHLSRGLISA